MRKKGMCLTVYIIISGKVCAVFCLQFLFSDKLVEFMFTYLYETVIDIKATETVIDVKATSLMTEINYVEYFQMLISMYLKSCYFNFINGFFAVNKIFLSLSVSQVDIVLCG